MERSNEDLSRFSYALSHDLVAPVQSVHALGELLLNGREGDLNDGQRQLIGMMIDAAAGMRGLVASMLGFAQVGQGNLDLQSVSVDEVIARVQVRLASAIQDSKATIHYDSLPVINADRMQIEQVLQNLLANGIQYRKPGEPVRISVSTKTVQGGWIFPFRTMVNAYRRSR